MKMSDPKSINPELVVVYQTIPASTLRDILNDPKRAADAAKLGWDITKPSAMLKQWREGL